MTSTNLQMVLLFLASLFISTNTLQLVYTKSIITLAAGPDTQVGRVSLYAVDVGVNGSIGSPLLLREVTDNTIISFLFYESREQAVYYVTRNREDSSLFLGKVSLNGSSDLGFSSVKPLPPIRGFYAEEHNPLNVSSDGYYYYYGWENRTEIHVKRAPLVDLQKIEVAAEIKDAEILMSHFFLLHPQTGELMWLERTRTEPTNFGINKMDENGKSVKIIAVPYPGVDTVVVDKLRKEVCWTSDDKPCRMRVPLTLSCASISGTLTRQHHQLSYDSSIAVHGDDIIYNFDGGLQRIKFGTAPESAAQIIAPEQSVYLKPFIIISDN